MSKKLIDERAILLFPSLAKQIGINNAIFIQQLHFLCDISDELGYGKLYNNERWVYKTAQEWHDNDFPFWSVVTIRRIINSLHDQGLIYAMYLDDDKWNRTLFYRINYSHCALASDQVDNMEVIKERTSKSSKRSNASDQYEQMLSENTTEITSQITTDINNVFSFWKTIFNKTERTKLEGKRLSSIKSRLKDGYSVDEIKSAIINVSKSQWHLDQGQTDIELICRNQINLDKYIALKPSQNYGYQQPQYQTSAQRTAQEHDKWRMAEQRAFGEKDVTPMDRFLIGESRNV